MLTECEIKSEIVSNHEDGACPQCVASPEHGCETIRLLAEAWSDHPDYRSDWENFHDGDYQVSASRANEILVQLSHPSAPRSTAWEMHVLRLFAEGNAYRDIAERSVVSVNTVKRQARSLLQRSRFLWRWADGQDR